MYGIVRAGGHQYKVEKGQTVRVQKLDGQPGDLVRMHDVLMVVDGDDVKVGSPVLSGAEVTGTIVEQGKAKKVLSFRFKRRQNVRKLRGHRQPYTAVHIDDIKA